MQSKLVCSYSGRVYRLVALLSSVITLTLIVSGLVLATSLNQQTQPTATVIVAGLNIRSGPGTNYGRIGGVKQGDNVVILEKTNNCVWLRVRTSENLEGWISGSSQYVTLNMACNAILSVEVPVTANATPTPQQLVASSTLTPTNRSDEQLIPYRAITQEQLITSAGGFTTVGAELELTGRAVLKNTSHIFLVVFLTGIDLDTEISTEMLDWTVLAAQNVSFKPISFGLLLKDEVLLMGNLTEGSVYPVSDGNNPLLPLVYIVPKTVNSFTLRNPQGNKYDLTVTKGWLPQEEHLITSAQFSDDSFVSIHLNDKNWCVTALRGCQAIIAKNSVVTESGRQQTQPTNSTPLGSEILTATMRTPAIMAEIKREKYLLQPLCDRLFIKLDNQVLVPNLLDCRHHFQIFKYTDGSLEVGPKFIHDGEITSSSEGETGLVFHNIKFVSYSVNDNTVDPSSGYYWGIGEIGVFATKGTPEEFAVTVTLDDLGDWSGVVNIKQPYLDFTKPVTRQSQLPLKQGN